jgi:carboxymethylenebutenolidase
MSSPSARPAELNPNLTGSHRPVAEEVQIPAKGIELKAVLVRPADLHTGPGVIVVHENKGLRPYLRDVANGLASNGYIAVVPDLLSREGGTESLTNPDREAPPKLKEIPTGRHIGDLQAVVEWLKGQPGVGPLGIVGFSFGGDLVWQMAAASKDLKAAVPFYGANPPLNTVPDIQAAVYGVYGALDEQTNKGIDAIEDRMKRAGKTFAWKKYPYAVHSFHNHTNRGIYHGASARQAWADTLSWLDQHLKGGARD